MNVRVCSIALVVGLSGCAHNQSPPPGSLAYDKSVFSSLLSDHDKIHRTVTEVPDGIESLTESDDPEVAARLMEHVRAMQARLKNDGRVRQWDPLFVTVFDHAEHVRLECTRTDKGVRVRETSVDPYVASIIKIHAGVVSGFVARGFEESALEHPVPPSPTSAGLAK